MKAVVKLFGIVPLFTIDLHGVVVTEEDEEDEDTSRIEGGSAHNFERDTDPVTPEDRYNWEWEEGKKRGFGFR